MQILSHRGYWKSSEEKNQEIAFRRSFKLNFGTETDVRDCAGKLVISHDMPLGTEMTLEYFLKIYNEYNPNLFLALNIKADGLQTELNKLLSLHQIKNYFLFDASIPDTIASLKAGLTCFTRQSEYEKEFCLYDKVKGIWIDSFETDWIDEITIACHLQNNKVIVIVSPELHKRAHLATWHKYRAMNILKNDNIFLCTDFPEDAKEFFY